MNPPGRPLAVPLESGALAARLHAALPQTQCTRCGYPDCAGYAQAIAAGRADINQCPPGGAEGIGRLAALTGRAPLPLNPGNGSEGPRAVALIDESWCIGCTLCLDVCPTDAIMGSNKLMHTVLEPYCTGCELCLPVCPVDCIALKVVSQHRSGWAAWSESLAAQALQRYEFHRLRLSAQGNRPDDAAANPKPPLPPVPQPGGPDDAAGRKRALIEASLARAKSRRTRPS